MPESLVDQSSFFGTFRLMLFFPKQPVCGERTLALKTYTFMVVNLHASFIIIVCIILYELSKLERLPISASLCLLNGYCHNQSSNACKHDILLYSQATRK